MSFISGTVAAIEGKKAQDNASKKNQQNVRNTNKLNYRMFQESRGSKGNAILPLYFQTESGQPFEKTMAKDLVDYYNQYRYNPQDYQDILEKYSPLFDSADNAAAGIFNGGTTNELLSNLEPVAAARTALSRQSALDALNRTLSEIDAANAAKGYTGDSLTANRLRFDARRAAGDASGNATLQNLQDAKQIKDAGVTLRLQNLGLPLQMAQQRGQILSLPQDLAGAAISRRLQPFQFFNIGTQAFQNQNAPEVKASPSALQLAAMSAGQLGGTLLNGYLQGRFNGTGAATAGTAAALTVPSTTGTAGLLDAGAGYGDAAAALA
jgi:hypothetical protein